MKFETGASTHAVNDLILFTDNTRQLAEHRDSIYQTFVTNGGAPEHWRFSTLIRLAKQCYYNQFTKADSAHIADMSYEEIKEFCTLYAQGFEDWKQDHSQ